jgi:hypothetical protein
MSSLSRVFWQPPREERPARSREVVIPECAERGCRQPISGHDGEHCRQHTRLDADDSRRIVDRLDRRQDRR